MTLDPRQRIILALDVDNTYAAREAVLKLRDHVGLFKIGFELFVAEGPAVVKTVRDLGGKVFLDLKFHDIPNTAAQAARVAVRLGATFFDLHASGGRAMMKAAAEAAGDEAARLGVPLPVSLAVTVLTSLKEEDLRGDLHIDRTPGEQAVSLALLAKGSGLGGVVASPMEAADIRKAAGDGFIIVTPGVRPVWAGGDDQQRFATPADAAAWGADYLVVGRPILRAADPVEAAIKIAEELK